MRKLMLIFPAAGLFFIAACTNQTTTSTVNVQNKPAATPIVVQSTPAPLGDGVPRISLADAKAAFDSGEAVFIDTHAKEQYDQQHIKGSINVPVNDIGTRLDNIPKGKKLIAYCS